MFGNVLNAFYLWQLPWKLGYFANFNPKYFCNFFHIFIEDWKKIHFKIEFSWRWRVISLALCCWKLETGKEKFCDTFWRCSVTHRHIFYFGFFQASLYRLRREFYVRLMSVRNKLSESSAKRVFVVWNICRCRNLSLLLCCARSSSLYRGYTELLYFYQNFIRNRKPLLSRMNFPGCFVHKILPSNRGIKK